MPRTPFVAIALGAFLVGCSSTSTNPEPGFDGGEATGSAGQHRDAGGVGGGGASDAGGGTPSDSGTSSGSGFLCYVTSGSCVCLDPPPAGYTATSCPSFSCCYTTEYMGQRECTCAPFTGKDCDDWRSGSTPAASCP